MADRESQRIPLANQIIKRSTDIEFMHPASRSTNNKKSSKCIVYFLLITVIAAALLLFFSTIVWRITSPHLKITSVTIQNLIHGNSTTSPSLNATMKAQITIENSNFGRFRFDGCKAVILYGNSTIGNGNIAGGSIGAKATEVKDVILKIGTEIMNISSDDTASGLVKLQSYAEMRGKVRVMKIAKKKVRVEMNCTMSLSLNSKSVHVLQCS